MRLDLAICLTSHPARTSNIASVSNTLRGVRNALCEFQSDYLRDVREGAKALVATLGLADRCD